MPVARNEPVDLRQSLQWHVMAPGSLIPQAGGAKGFNGRSSSAGTFIR